MRTIVVDTSVIVKWLDTRGETSVLQANSLMNAALAGQVLLLAPELAKYEMGNALLRGKTLPLEVATVVLHTAYNLPVTFVPESESTAIQAYAWAKTLGITYYDATFIALAEKSHAELVTENMKHQGKAASAVMVVALQDFTL